MKMKWGAATIVWVSPFPVDPWSPSVDSHSIASQLFAVSLFFLYFITRSRTAPPLTLFGLLAFVGATIPAGIYAISAIRHFLILCGLVAWWGRILPYLNKCIHCYGLEESSYKSKR